MAGKQRYTQKQVLDALNSCGGLLFLAAEKLGCSSQTICTYMNRYPAIRRAVAEKRGRRVDIGEAALDNAVLAGEGWAVQFLLRTQGRDRGYFDKTVLEGGEIPLQVRIIRDDNFYRNADRLPAERNGASGADSAPPGAHESNRGG